MVTEQGFADFSLEDIAARADVTRNLLYHYFPRGRADIVLAVLDHAGHELTDGWILDDAIPLPERIAANNTRVIAQAMEPTQAWTLYRMARGTTDPEVTATIDRFADVVVTSMSLNHLGTTDPRRSRGSPCAATWRSSRPSWTTPVRRGRRRKRCSPCSAARSSPRWRVRGRRGRQAQAAATNSRISRRY